MLNRLMALVRPGVELVWASFFRPTRLLIRLDLPTFDRPANTTLGRSGTRPAFFPFAPASEVTNVHSTVPHRRSTVGRTLYLVLSIDESDSVSAPPLGRHVISGSARALKALHGNAFFTLLMDFRPVATFHRGGQWLAYIFVPGC